MRKRSRNGGIKNSYIMEVVDDFNCNSKTTYQTTSSMFVGFSPCPSSSFFQWNTTGTQT
jgi:hypothetical protein